MSYGSMTGTRARQVPASPTAELDAVMKAMAAAGEDVVNLGAGETDFATPSVAADGAHQAIDEQFTRYTPTAGIAPLRQAIADWLTDRYDLGYGPADIVVSNGAKQALFNTMLAVLDPDDEVLVAAPYWVSYPWLVSLAGGRPVIVPPDPAADLKLTPEAIARHTGPRTRAVILNNPANPTGAVYARDELERLVHECRRHGLVIISDEIYDQQVYPPARFHPVAGLDPDVAAHTVTVGGFSKTFAMTGWRVGFTAAPAPTSATLAAIQGHTTSAPSSVSQRAALAALTDPTRDKTLASRLDTLDRRRRSFAHAVEAVPGLRLGTAPLGAFYAFVDVTDLYGRADADGQALSSAADIASALLRHERLGVVPGEQFGAPGYLRLSYVGDDGRLAEATKRLHRFCTTTTHPKT